MNSREQFEESVVTLYENSDLERKGDGYRNAHIQAAWWGWKTSRESLVIDLQPPAEFDVTAEESLEMDPDEYEAEEACHGAEWSAYSRAKKAIEAAGLRVAP